jgi:hypothetical protein
MPISRLPTRPLADQHNEFNETADPLPSAARSDTRDHPLSRPDPRPSAPPAGAFIEGDSPVKGSFPVCLHNRRLVR